MQRTILVSFASLFLAFLFWSTDVLGVPGYITFPANIDWATRSSQHFQIIFRDGEDRFAERALIAAERAWNQLTPIFPEPPAKIYIVLGDFQDSTNGYALTFPYPHIVLFAAPPESAGQLASLDDWLDSVVLHELVHILHIYPANGLWGGLRSVFGSIISPNGLMPSHFHEGLAVFLETEKTQGGRGRSATFHAFRRMAVHEGVWGTEKFFSIDQMDGAPIRYPQGTTPYFFGYYLYEEMWKRKGAKGIYELVYDYSRNWPFLLNGPLETVYGTDYYQLWKEAFAKNAEVAANEIAAIKKEGPADVKYLTDSRQGKWDLSLSLNKDKAAYRNYQPDKGATIEIVKWDEQSKIETLEVSSGADGMCWGGKGEEEVLYFVDNENRNQYQLHVLKKYYLSTKKTEEVKADAVALEHIHDIACSAKGPSLLVYQEFGGKGKVLELQVAENRATVKRSWSIPESTWVSGLHFTTSDSARIFLRRGMVTEGYAWNTGDPALLTKFQGHLFQPLPGERGETIAIANLDGRNEIWKFEFDKQEATKLVTLMGGANSFELLKDGIALSSYRHGGFDLGRVAIAPKKPVRLASRFNSRTIAESTPPAPETAKLTAKESYSPLETLIPKTWVPSFFVVPDGAQVGLFVPAFDLSQKHFFQFFAGYDTRGLPFGDMGYTYRFGSSYSLSTSVYYLSSYIIALKEFFKRWGSNITFGGRIGTTGPTLSIGPTFRRVEALGSLPGNQSVGVQVGVSQTIGLKTTPTAVAPTRATMLSLAWSQYFQALGSTDNYFSAIASAEQYLEAPWAKDHVIYAAAKLGYTEGTALYVNYLEAGGEVIFSQGRGLFLNRGFYPGTFLGRRIFNTNLEYRFPIANVYRGKDLWPLYLKRVYGSVVADTTSADLGVQSTSPQNLFRTFHWSAGAELRSDWQLGFYLPAHIRLGAYHGFGPFGEPFYFVMGFEAAI